MAAKQEWWIKRKGQADLGPLTHREARRTALAVADSGGGVPKLQRRRQGEPTRTILPRFPALERA